MAKNSTALIFIALGAICIITGSCIMCAGGFKSVMIDPADGPYKADQISANSGHYALLLLVYPEMFNCNTLNDDFYAGVDNTNLALYSFARAADATLNIATAMDYTNVRDNARAYCRYHDGEQAWGFALYLPLALLVLGLSIASFIRKSGYTLGLVGVGLSSVMIVFTLLIVVWYQAASFIPQALNHFTDCDGLTAATREEIKGFASATNAGFYHLDLQGPIPRRGWLCEDEWDYDSDLKTAANLVYGGAAVNFVGFLALLLAFAYLVQPFVTPVPTAAKAPVALASTYRGADDVDFDDESYTYSDYSEY